MKTTPTPNSYIRELLNQIESLTAEKEAAENTLLAYKDEQYERHLQWRGIDVEYGGVCVCKGCGGTGIKTYGSTSTWHGGIGGCQMTADVCDKCWGSGDSNNPWTNLRTIYGMKQAKETAESSLAQAREEIALLRVQKGQLEDREEAAEQGLAEARTLWKEQPDNRHRIWTHEEVTAHILSDPSTLVAVIEQKKLKPGSCLPKGWKAPILPDQSPAYCESGGCACSEIFECSGACL